MGATTAFTAKEAGQGMEALGRASLSTGQIITAIQPTLNMAAADTMELGQAATIVASSMKQFSLKAGKAQMIADVLAYTSAKSNTNVTELGEALKYVGATAFGAGQSFENTVGSLALLANIGIRGSAAGTALASAIVKLTKQTSAARKLFGGKAGLNRALTDTSGKMRPINQIILQAVDRLKKIKNEATRAKLAFEMFGIRGKKAMDAFMAGKADPKSLAKHFEDIGNKAAGMAQKMAQARLDNLAGDFTLLKSAAEGVAISIGSMIVPSLRALISGGTGKGGAIAFFQNLAHAINMVNTGAKETAVAKKYGGTIAAVAFGIKEAIAGVKEAFIEVGKTIKPIFKKFFGGGKQTIKTIAKIATKAILFLTILGPIAIGLGAVSMAAGGMFKVLSGGLGLIKFAFSPLGLAIGVVAIAIKSLKREGESTFGFLHRIIKGVASAFSPLIRALKWMVKHVGVLGTVVGVGIAAKGGKMLLGGLLGRVAGRFGGGGMLGGLAARMSGAQPVYVVNWPTGLGVGGAAPGGTISRVGGWLAGIGAWAKGLGGAGLTFGGVGLKTAAIGMAGLGASIGTFFLGLKKLADAHSKKEQAKLATRMGKLYPAMARAHEISAAGGYMAYKWKEIRQQYYKKTSQYQKVQKYGGRLHPTVYMGEAMGKLAGGATTLGQFKREGWTLEFLRQMYRLAKAGRVGEARKHLFEAGITQKQLQTVMTGMSDAGKKFLGLTPDMVRVLGNLEKIAIEFKKGMRKPQTTIIKLDGKQIAIAVGKIQQGASERSGKTPSAGAKRRNLRTGKGGK